MVMVPSEMRRAAFASKVGLVPTALEKCALDAPCMFLSWAVVLRTRSRP